MRRRAALAVAVVLAAVFGGCARSLTQVRWDEAYVRASRDRDVSTLDHLAATAPRAIDAGQARLDAARALRDSGRPDEAAARFKAIGDDAPRIDDRARGRYELARLAEDTGNRDEARALYRALVLTYPTLMPGERALAHLFRMAKAEGADAVGAHLAWTLEVYPTLAPTSLGDNLIFQAAEVAAERYARTSAIADWDLAVLLYRRIIVEHPRGGLWDDAQWELSWLFHKRALYDDEIAAIEAIQRRREAISFFGQDEHPYFYVGQRRLARLFLVYLDDPVRSRDAWRSYAATWTRSIFRDDAWYYAGCAGLVAGDAEGARADFASIAEHRPESRFIRRVDAALADPRGPHCVPPEEKP